MFSTFDRYLVREAALPLVLSVLLITFPLLISPMLSQGYPLIAQGVPWSVVAKVLLTLLPQALALSIPMAILMGLLVTLSRMSADREFVAMQACGVSIFSLLRPVAGIAGVGIALTAYIMIESVPNANQTFREITLREAASLVEKNVKPDVLISTFPQHAIYVRDVSTSGEWRDVFLADTSKPDHTSTYFAREGRIVVDRVKKLVEVQLRNGAQHTISVSRPDDYETTEFETSTLTLDPAVVFPAPPARGVPEMTIAELRENIAKSVTQGNRTDEVRSRLQLQYKFSFPAACGVLALVGLALGATNRKEGKLASFAIGFIVIFVYYVLLYMGQAAAKGGILNPDIAPWIPNLVLAVVGVGLTIRTARTVELPALLTRLSRGHSTDRSARSESHESPSSQGLARRHGWHVTWPGIRILDLYTSRQYVRIFGLAVFAALGIFYISTFIDVADKLFRGAATTPLLLRYFYYLTPQYVYYIIPIAGLVATLVTIGVMARNSELVVMHACGISLYRMAAPIVIFAVAASALLFGLQEWVLAPANREADRLNRIIRGFPPLTMSQVDRWTSSKTRRFYHFDTYDERTNRFSGFTAYQIEPLTWRLIAITYARQVVPTGVVQASNHGDWHAQEGWMRTMATAHARTKVVYEPFVSEPLALESPRYFKAEAPEPSKMTYAELSEYVQQMKAGGLNVGPLTVQLQRKIAFPFAAVIMTLLAIPFAVTTGRRGAMYGIGLGIVLSMGYWVILNIFSALGEGGVLPPLLAAWAPNLLTGVGALFAMLTVRT